MEKLSMINLIVICLFVGAIGFGWQFFGKIGEALGDYCVKRYLLWKQKRVGKK